MVRTRRLSGCMTRGRPIASGIRVQAGAADRVRCRRIQGTIAKDAPRRCRRRCCCCARLGGCGVQSVYVTESLAGAATSCGARSSRCVAVLDRARARSAYREAVAQPSFLEAESGRIERIDRRSDLLAAIDVVTADAQLGRSSMQRASARSAIRSAATRCWGSRAHGRHGSTRRRCRRRDVALPAPFLAHDSLKTIDVPVMYQGAVFRTRADARPGSRARDRVLRAGT